MNILITGGSGFIGTHLIQKLIKNSKIETIVNLDICNPKLAHSKITYIECDIRHKINIDIPQKVSLCIHLAALCKEPGFEWEEYFKTNLKGTENVIDFCEENDIKKIIFTSTMMVYKPGEESKNEYSLTDPDTAYGISKLAAELVLREWKALENGKALKIIRPSVVFGTCENGNFTRLYQSLKRNQFVYVGRNDTVKSNVYVKDVIDFIIFLTMNETDHSIYNFAFPKAYTIKEICNTFKSTANIKSFIPTLPYKLLLLVSYGFLFLNEIGFKNSIHPRRIQKLYQSTNITAELSQKSGYVFKYDLKTALEDWKHESKGDFI